MAIPAAQASSAASIISINATSPSYPGLKASDHGRLFKKYAVVVYKDGGAATGVVSGKVTTTATNDTAQLMKEQFGQTKYTDVGTPQPLTTVNSTTAKFSFSVTPSLATHYKVQLAGTDTELSSAVTVYVTAGGRPFSDIKASCSPTTCKLSFRATVLLPSSALKTEMKKHWFLYLAIGYPRLPKNYTLDKSATESRAKRVKGGYARTLTYRFRLGNGRPNPFPAFCTKDSESKDGMGLPGHHSCGAKRVPRTVIYLG
jgi:hypothetical protein